MDETIHSRSHEEIAEATARDPWRFNLLAGNSGVSEICRFEQHTKSVSKAGTSRSGEITVGSTPD